MNTAFTGQKVGVSRAAVHYALLPCSWKNAGFLFTHLIKRSVSETHDVSVFVYDAFWRPRVLWHCFKRAYCCEQGPSRSFWSLFCFSMFLLDKSRPLILHWLGENIQSILHDGLVFRIQNRTLKHFLVHLPVAVAGKQGLMMMMMMMCSTTQRTYVSVWFILMKNTS